MKLSQLQVGIKLQLEVDSFIDPNSNMCFVSAFEWAENDDTALIAAPIHEGMVYPLQKGTMLNIFYIMKGDFYGFKAEVMDRTTKDNIPLIKIKITGDISRIQRRQFFRLECCLPVKYGVLQSLTGDTKSLPRNKKAVVRDLSGGGICIAVEEQLEKDAYLICEIVFSKENTVVFSGQVVRIDKLEDNMAYKFEIGVKFIKIEDKHREAIIGYIFQEQRKLRQKGLI
ncbi:MAG: PilZ domain-containing protein [Clostridia bacterium]|nr:PilZ domain-containing protein [Clostridia bacterium]